MKKINTIRSYQMTHGLHLQFFVALIILIKKFEFITLKIGVLLDLLRACVEKEDLSYKIVHKSDISKLKAEKDQSRDDMVAGIKNALKAALYHFDKNVREAARRLKIVFDHYDKPKPIIDLPYDIETVTIKNLVQEFENKYAADIQLTGLTEWIKELNVRNNDFEQLSLSYNKQLSEKVTLRPKETRLETDNTYKDIITVIEGLIILELNEKALKDETESEYYPFVKELNVLIAHYNDQVARHLGRIHAEKEKEKEKKEKNNEL